MDISLFESPCGVYCKMYKTDHTFSAKGQASVYPDGHVKVFSVRSSGEDSFDIHIFLPDLLQLMTMGSHVIFVQQHRLVRIDFEGIEKKMEFMKALGAEDSGENIQMFDGELKRTM